MRTPAGKECKHYYEDYNRGRNVKECRLAKENPASLSWKPTDCKNCAVPAILNANASPDLQLTLTIKQRMLGLGRQNIVTATCIKHDIPVTEPQTGCAQCNNERPGLDVFRKALGSDK